MNTKLMDFKKEMTSLKVKLNEHMSLYTGENPKLLKELKTIEKIYSMKLDATQPEIMVYGIYNAGKSSILNELIGEDKAKVQDIPTTDQVTYYEWNGYRIADTPGIGAPIKHEQVTQLHLKQADVVIFIMSTTGSNERRENYIRMKEITDSGKKLIVVLNDKNGDLFDGEGNQVIQTIKTKVINNMHQIGIDDVEKYYVLAVNAQRAKTGRLKKNQMLWEKSNMSELANVIMQELKETDSFSILGNAIHEIENVLKDVQSTLSLMGNDNDAKNINELVERINSKKKEIRESLHAFIVYKADLLGRELPGLIWSKRNQPEDEINTMIQGKIAGIAEQIQKDFENKLMDLKNEIMDITEDFQIKVKDLNYQAQDINVRESKNEKVTEEFDLLGALSKVSEALKEIDFVNTAVGKNKTGLSDFIPTESLVSQAVQTAAKTNIGKSILASSIGKTFLAPVLPVVGPVVTFVPIIYKLLKGSDDSEGMRADADAQNRQMKMQAEAEAVAREELNQKCMYMAADLADTFKISIDTSLQTILAEIIKPFKEEGKKRQSANAAFRADVLAIGEIMDAYAVLRSNLKSNKV